MTRPRPRVALAPLLAVALLVQLLAGCGDSGDSGDAGDDRSLRREDYIAAGDAICGDAEAALGEVEPPGGDADLPAFVAGLRAVVTDARDAFAALDPPQDAAEFHRLELEAFEDFLATLDDVDAAIEEGDDGRIATALAGIDEVGREADEAAADYGFEVCGAEGS